MIGMSGRFKTYKWEITPKEARLLQNIKNKHCLKLERGSFRAASAGPIESSGEKIVVHCNTSEYFTEGVVSGYHPRRGKHTRRANLYSTQIRVFRARAILRRGRRFPRKRPQRSRLLTVEDSVCARYLNKFKGTNTNQNAQEDQRRGQRPLKSKKKIACQCKENPMDGVLNAVRRDLCRWQSSVQHFMPLT